MGLIHFLFWFLQYSYIEYGSLAKFLISSQICEGNKSHAGNLYSHVCLCVGKQAQTPVTKLKSMHPINILRSHFLQWREN